MGCRCFWCGLEARTKNALANTRVWPYTKKKGGTMKIVRFAKDRKVGFGILDESPRISVLTQPPWQGLATDDQRLPLAQVRLLAPVRPPDIIAIGLNYREHARESGAAIPEAPVVFLKASSSVIGPETPIELPAMAPDEVDYEAEVGIVIGRPCRNVEEDQALNYVLGYTCANDVSARDCQRRLDVQWARAKSFQTFCPLGPWIETELDPDDISVQLRLNGKTMQSGRTSDMIFDCRQLVAYCSRVFTLQPGTVILSGTPPGVGFARQPPVFLRSGDRVEVVIEGIGSLGNPVVKGE